MALDAGQERTTEEAAALARVLPPELAKEIQDDPSRAIEIVAAMWHHHSGPLPSPATFAGYEQVLPGAAERVFGLTEREAEHRHWMDGHYVAFRYCGVACGFVVALAAIGGAIFLADRGKNAVALAIVLADVAGVVGLFLAARLRRRPKGGEQSDP